MTDMLRRPFIVIGENIHATRVVLRAGQRVVALPDGRPALTFTDESGTDRILPVSDAALDGPDGPRQRVKHVKAAVLAGQSDDPTAVELGRGYVRAMARRQAAAGAHYLDLNVDEVVTDPDGRAAAMRWLVQAVEDATHLPLALDSSSTAVLGAGLAATPGRGGSPLLNSAASDRLDVLDLAVAHGCPVVLSATSPRGMPASSEERVSNAKAIVETATGVGIPLSDLYVDALVIPVGVDPEAGRVFLEAVSALRNAFGPELHLTGGLSNISFGLPARRLLNDVFIDLAAAAGADGGIIDPVANDPRRVFEMDRSSPAYRLASDLLTGVDPYGSEFLKAFRDGRLD